MHDILRDFCRQRALQECFFHETDWRGNICADSFNVHRVILNSYVGCVPWTFSGCKRVRSILWFSKSEATSKDAQWGNFKLLKVLDVLDAEFKIFPVGSPQKSHLRYLALHLSTMHKHMLSPIFEFQNLETLIIDDSNHCITLPSEFWQMRRLRHLIVNWMKLTSIPKVRRVPNQKLECMQTLETVNDFKLTKEAIEIIPNLRKLKIAYECNGDGSIWKLYGLNNLANLLQLEKLKISFCRACYPYNDSFQCSFAFPRTLKKLSLEGCCLKWEDLTTVGCLPCLKVLRLRSNAVVGKEWEPIEGEFQQLKFLLMHRLNLKHWKAGSAHFPCLEHLKISECHELTEIPLEIGEIVALKSITLFNNRVAEKSAKLILEEQQSQGNDELQVLV